MESYKRRHSKSKSKSKSVNRKTKGKVTRKSRSIDKEIKTNRNKKIINDDSSDEDYKDNEDKENEGIDLNNKDKDKDKEESSDDIKCDNNNNDDNNANQTTLNKASENHIPTKKNNIKPRNKNTNNTNIITITNNKNKDNDNESDTKQLPIELTDITEKLCNSTIYCRENERETILSFLTTTTPSSSKTLFISGQPGTGKTSLILDIFSSPPLQSPTYFFKLTINCMTLSSIQEFHNQIFHSLNTTPIYSHLKSTYPKSYDTLITLLKQTPNNKCLMSIFSLLTSSTILIVLDEIDFFYRKNNEMLFFDIINLPHLIKGDMKMILISNNSDFDNEIFPKLQNRKINTMKIVFKPYTSLELTNIMKKKLEDIGMIDYFTNDSIRFLSSKMNKTGDLRPVIEIIKGLILRYKEDFIAKRKTIGLKDMFDVLKAKNIQLSEIITGMTTEQKIVVVAVCYGLKKGDDANLDEKEIYEEYKKIKREFKAQMLSIEEFREVLKSFCEVGLMEAKGNKGKGRGKGKGNNVFRVKYSEEDLEIIFADGVVFRMFKRGNEKDDDNNGVDDNEDDDEDEKEEDANE